MELQHVNVKLRVNDAGEQDMEALIPVFHRWIREQALDGLLLDVADYRHVPSGPGVVLIGHEADYSVDNADNRLGVRYNRKAAGNGSNLDRLTQAARAALTACQRLETDPELGGAIRFNGRELEVFFNDRLLVPNNAETRRATAPELDAFFDKLFSGGGYSLSYPDDPRRLFAVSVQTERAFPSANLLANLGS
jgi:hypothetical protein